jgi:hypothetical protein
MGTVTIADYYGFAQKLSLPEGFSRKGGKAQRAGAVLRFFLAPLREKCFLSRVKILTSGSFCAKQLLLIIGVTKSSQSSQNVSHSTPPYRWPSYPKGKFLRTLRQPLAANDS